MDNLKRLESIQFFRYICEETAESGRYGTKLWSSVSARWVRLKLGQQLHHCKRQMGLGWSRGGKEKKILYVQLFISYMHITKEQAGTSASLTLTLIYTDVKKKERNKKKKNNNS